LILGFISVITINLHLRGILIIALAS